MVEIKLNINKNLLIASLSGELDHHTAKIVKNSIEEKIKNHVIKNLIFDFSDLTFMDSSGIGVIMGRYKSVKTLGGKVVVFGQKPQIKRIISMSGIEKIVKLADTFEQALKLL